VDRPEEHHRATFAASRQSDKTVRVTVSGEVDAANSRALSDYVERHIAGCPQLVLDLSGVEFFGTAGFASLHHVNLICAQYRASWVLVVAPELRRFLKICDPDHILPLTDAVPH
jgi:anti-anti-sigma factor